MSGRDVNLFSYLFHFNFESDSGESFPLLKVCFSFDSLIILRM